MTVCGTLKWDKPLTQTEAILSGIAGGVLCRVCVPFQGRVTHLAVLRHPGQARPGSLCPPGSWGNTRGTSAARTPCDRGMQSRELAPKGEGCWQRKSPRPALTALCASVGRDSKLLIAWLLFLCEKGFRMEGLWREGMPENEFGQGCGRALGNALA